MPEPHSPLRLILDGEALVANWRWLEAQGAGAACGAAVKADGYGLGARDVVLRLANAGCRDFFVATWPEAEALLPWLGAASLSVLHGVAEEDLPQAAASPARPGAQHAAPGRALEGGGAGPALRRHGRHRHQPARPDARREVADGLLDGLEIDTLMSHLACADEDEAMNARQRAAFAEVAGAGAGEAPQPRQQRRHLPRRRITPSTSPGPASPSTAACRGARRRGISARSSGSRRRSSSAAGSRRAARSATTSTWTAEAPAELAILNLGYADGYLRGFSGTGRARLDGGCAPVVGRVSMDLTAIRVDEAPELGEGDWVELDYALPAAAAQSGLSQYELLTTLGGRHERVWK